MAERPEYLTVPEVMAHLRLRRTTVYEQARLYLATNGAEGLPCRRFGRSLRFPAAAFDASVGDSATRRTTDVVDLPASHTRQQPGAPRASVPLRTVTPTSQRDARCQLDAALASLPGRMMRIHILDTHRTDQHDRQVPAGGGGIPCCG